MGADDAGRGPSRSKHELDAVDGDDEGKGTWSVGSSSRQRLTWVGTQVVQ